MSKTNIKQASSGNGGDLGLYFAVGGAIAFAALAGIIVIKKKGKKRAGAPV